MFKYCLTIFPAGRNLLFFLMENFDKMIMFWMLKNLARACKEKYHGN